MPFICCVPGCGEFGKKSLHAFPKNELQCRNWITATMSFHLNKATAWKSYYKVCRKHFQNTDFKNCNLLQKNVVPSLMLPHTITMEHDYCERNSLIMHAAKTNDISGRPEDNGVFSIQEENCMSEVVTENSNKGGEVQAGCVLGNNIAEEEANCMMEVVNEDRNKGYDVEEVSFVLGNNIAGEELNCMMEVMNEDRGSDNDLQKVDCVLRKNIAENPISVGNPSDNQKPFFSVNINVKRVYPVEEKSKSKSKYDPAARKMRYLKARNEALSKKLKDSQTADLKSNKKSKIKRKIEETLRTLCSILPPEQYDFVKLQIGNAGKRKRGNRFTFDEKTLALAIYKSNPKRYKDLTKIANLPTRQTLITHSAMIQFSEGVNPKIMEFIKEAVSKMDEMDKICTMGWDEMSLSTHLDFRQVKDYIDGFEDLGSKRSQNFATHALVFMVRGIKVAYKQPIAYFLTGNLDSAELAELIRLVIEAVLDTGLKIIGSVCDGVATNIAAVNKLINPSCRRGNTTGTLLEYTINGSNIVHCFDAPHLIKSVRNNLLVKDLKHSVSFNETKFKPNGMIVWNEKSKVKRIASWKDISNFYDVNNNQNGLFNLIPNITDEHMNPDRRKMKVKLASQVFSGTYGRNMYVCSKRKQLPNNDCIGTAAILLFFNDVFDSVNGDGVIKPDKLTGSLTEESKHFKFWDYAITMLDTMTFTENLKTGKPNKSNVLKHFMTTLKGLRKISQRLFQLGFQSIPLRQLNQDGLENHFSIIRSLCGSNTNPNARDFRCAYSTSLLNNLLSDHSLNANCEADKDSPLVRNLRVLFTDKDKLTQCLTQETDKIDIDNLGVVSILRNTVDSPEIGFPEGEALNCISGKICKQLMKKTKCVACCVSIEANGKCVDHYIMSKQSTVDEFVLPNSQFMDYTKILILNVKEMLPVLCAEKNLMQKLLSGLTIRNKNQLIGCEHHRNEFLTEIKKITLKVTIERFTQQINKILSGKVTTATEDPIQKKALEFRTKKKHIGKFIPSSNA